MVTHTEYKFKPELIRAGKQCATSYFHGIRNMTDIVVSNIDKAHNFNSACFITGRFVFGNEPKKRIEWLHRRHIYYPVDEMGTFFEFLMQKCIDDLVYDYLKRHDLTIVTRPERRPYASKLVKKK